MVNLLYQARHLLRRYRVFPRKRLGQNFIVERFYLNLLVDYAELAPEDVVLEIGAGLGFLTELLAKKAEKVIAVEIDPRLVRVLRKRFRGIDNIEIVQGDILKTNLQGFNKVVSTPPYSISSHLLFWILEKPFSLAVLTFQKEFAARLNASIGSDDYCRLSVMTYYKAWIELLDEVPKEAFYPPPEVDSVIVRIKPRENPPFKIENEEVFQNVVRTLFTQKNKKVRNAAVLYFKEHGFNKREAQKLAAELPFSEKKVRDLAPEDFGEIANEICKKNIL
ncbi:ribosomal RNA small subunit methyltransferase A [Candidatus Bathyarchaeota archaeon]|nr:ribosomal RNA small subunit methyltransferase A [Candidatus Bathyarchaeota archaeon]